ncbi:MAG TPA: alpha/beta hydrolase [Verrucomicrobiales bacterium]|nr:alpha/beta hydrolase [Verrucomicrobiales bacterium]HIL70634.1 alpha/beta hydrolase [Verrucomicrobiota bacterium]
MKKPTFSTLSPNAIPSRSGREFLKQSTKTALIGSVVANLTVAIGLLLLLTADISHGQNPTRPKPTHTNVAYGPHERNVVDFYKADSEDPTPVLVYFHGGGFRGGDKRGINIGLHKMCMDNEISFAAVNYRLSHQSIYPAPMHDSARAIQFLRSRATEWNIDSKRIAAFGGSAGAGISLWLGFHDDMADLNSTDLVVRQSTRLCSAIGLQAQSTYDPREIKKIVPGDAYKHTALIQLYGLPSNWDWDSSEVSDKLSNQLRNASPITHLTKDDPPVLVYHRKAQEKPGDIHHAAFGRHLKKKMDQLGIKCLHRMDTDFNKPNGLNRAILEFVKESFESSTSINPPTSAP